MDKTMCNNQQKLIISTKTDTPMLLDLKNLTKHRVYILLSSYYYIKLFLNLAY